MSQKKNAKKLARPIGHEEPDEHAIYVHDEDERIFLEGLRNEKRLQPDSRLVKLKKEKLLENKGLGVQPPPFRTREDLERLIDFQGFKQAIQSTTDIDLLRLADKFAEEIREITQRQIKIELWGREVPGMVHFNEIIKSKKLKDGSVAQYGYLKASTRESTRIARPLDEQELENTLQRQELSFQRYAAKETKPKSR